uniref:Domain of unknown function DB domain-containing protein n=1 Tax=Panagrolaimus superbus TaxID=310955 RepID=A0A914XVC9_9BILA
MKTKEYYTDEDFLDALNYATNKFQACCSTLVDEECQKYVCKYGLDTDYMQSAFITKCKMDNGSNFKEFIRCSNQNMDNYNCCRSLGIGHDCCHVYMAMPIDENVYNSDKFISQCLDVLKAISYCPVLNF